MSAPQLAAELEAQRPSEPQWPGQVREFVRLAGQALRRSAVAAWSGALVIVMICRLALRWEEFCEHSGIAVRRTKRQRWVSSHELRQGRAGAPPTELIGVPRIRRVRANRHGARVTFKVPSGHDRARYVDRMGALRHTLQIQHAKVVEVPGKPGFLELHLLRRDPLDMVTMVPRMDGKMIYNAVDVNGMTAGVDLGKYPHLLVAGATGVGKSSYVNSMLVAVAHSEHQFILWDLKFGLEAQLMAARASSVCETSDQVEESTAWLLQRAAQRADILKTFGVQNVDDLEKKHKVKLRRIFVVVDEVAELALSTVDGEDAKEKAARIEETMSQLLRLVQLVRSMGIHVIASGQRFGSDIGPKITSIRAQISGRACGKVNDVETARMTLPGMDSTLLDAVMGFDRPGMVGLKEGQDLRFVRSPYFDADALRTIAVSTVDKRLTPTQIVADDEQRAYGHRLYGGEQS